MSSDYPRVAEILDGFEDGIDRNLEEAVRTHASFVGTSSPILSGVHEAASWFAQRTTEEICAIMDELVEALHDGLRPEEDPTASYEEHYRLHLLKIGAILGIDTSYFEETGDEDPAILHRS